MNQQIIFLVTTLFLLSSNAYDDHNLKLSTSTTSGAAMRGAIFTAYYTDGTEEQSAPWINVTSTFGQTFGAGFYVAFDGTSTFPADTGPQASRGLWWLIGTGDPAPLRAFSFDMYPASALWDDIYNTTEEFTLNSGNGFPFTIFNSTMPVNIDVSYSGIPTFPGRQFDVFYVLNVNFTNPEGFTGTIRFFADTDSLTPIENCSVVPYIEPLQVIYVPQLQKNTNPPALYSQNGIQFAHFEFRSPSASNRRTGVDQVFSSWFYFGNISSGPNEPFGCTSGVDYNWLYRQETSENGTCIDIYTLDIELSLLTGTCGLTFVNDTTTQEIRGVITVRTISDRIVTRSSGTVITSETEEYSEHGFIIRLSTDVVIATTNVRVYASTEVSAIIVQYQIPLGIADKSIYIQTYIQDPDNQGFLLQYPYPNRTVVQRDELTSDPTSERNLIPSLVEVSDGCTITNNNLCQQTWLLTLDISHVNGPTVCKLTDLYFEIPYKIICDNPDPLLCPLTSSTDYASIVVYVDTQNFCPIIIASYSFTGSLITYYSDFSQPHIGFFTNDTVGFELTISDITGNNLQSNIQGIDIVWLAAALGDNITSSDLFSPNFYSLFSRPGVSAAILIGADTSQGYVNRASDAQLVPNACNGLCSSNTLRFSFVLSSLLWPIPADTYQTLRVGLVANLVFNNKKSVQLYFQSDNNQFTSTTSLDVVTPKTSPPQDGNTNPTTNNTNGASRSLLPISLFLLFVLISIFNFILIN